VNVPGAFGEQEIKLVHFCHGAPGMDNGVTNIHAMCVQIEVSIRISPLEGVRMRKS
jgi:hypothetical protein